MERSESLKLLKASGVLTAMVEGNGQEKEFVRVWA